MLLLKIVNELRDWINGSIVTVIRLRAKKLKWQKKSPHEQLKVKKLKLKSNLTMLDHAWYEKAYQ